MQAGAKINIINQGHLNAVQTHIRSSLFLYRKLNARILQVLTVSWWRNEILYQDGYDLLSVSLERSFSGADQAGLFEHLCRCVYQKTSAESG